MPHVPDEVRFAKADGVFYRQQTVNDMFSAASLTDAQVIERLNASETFPMERQRAIEEATALLEGQEVLKAEIAALKRRYGRLEREHPALSQMLVELDEAHERGNRFRRQRDEHQRTIQSTGLKRDVDIRELKRQLHQTQATLRRLLSAFNAAFSMLDESIREGNTILGPDEEETDAIQSGT